MAFTVLSSLTQTIDQILKDDQYPISARGKQRIASMRRLVHSFKEILERIGKNWRLEGRMRDVANEAEDILEHFMYEQIRLRTRLSRALAAGIPRANSIPKEYDFEELIGITKEMDSVAREIFQDLHGSDSPKASISRSNLPARTGNYVVGFDEDLFKIKEMLYRERDRLQMIALVGMAGIGKTTLAKMAYNEPMIQEHFDICVWVSVSNEYNIKKILRKLLHAMKEFRETIPQQSIKSLTSKVFMKLINRRYLIVLDDVWSTNIWKGQSRLAFPENDNGSRIMLTTRLSDVASSVKCKHVHHMRFMSVDESWHLLKQMVFKNETSDCELEKIGKEIAAKCEGLPLAIELIADVLSSESKTKASWEKIAEDVNSALYQSNDEQFEKTISLSYRHLPRHLRPCFLYMGGFPEGYEIHVSKLIKLWIAEGFVTPSSSKTFEVAAEEYLEDLVKRSLAFVKRRKSNGQIKSCSIHDLVREFCKRRVKEENIERRLSIAHSDLKCLAKTYGSTIRSVICFRPSETSLDALRKLRLLRVLDVVDANSNVFSLPAQVFEMFHLRYLAFGCPMKIPAAISMLQNLQTLIIHPRKESQHYMDEVYLPLEIWMITKLRHLVSFFDILTDPEETDFALQDLQTLSVVKKFRCTRRMLRRVPHLKKLGITLSRDEYLEASQLDNLVYLYELEKLKLFWNGDPTVQAKVNPLYPAMLKKLTLSGWRLPWKHLEAIGSLPNLKVLKLRHYACQGDTWETIEGQFYKLIYLLIDESDIQHWITEYSHFPRLRCLVIYRCPLLSEIPDGIADSPCLELIELGNGSRSLVESAKRVLEEQHDLGNEDLQVRFVHDQETSMVGDEFDGSKSKF